jgi:tetratricopeptide (TPR) repeat protein
MKAFELDPKITVGMNPADPGEGLRYCAGQLYESALVLFDKQKNEKNPNYEGAYELLVKAYKADEQDYITFLLAYTAKLTEKTDVAKTYYNAMIHRQRPTNNISVYQNLANIYKTENDTVKVLNVMKVGEPIFLVEKDTNTKNTKVSEKPKEPATPQKPKKNKEIQDNKDTINTQLSKETKEDTLYREFALSYSFFLSWAGKTDDATDIINTALEKYPDNNVLLISYATALIEDKQYAKAEMYLKKALEIQPNEYIAIYNLGNCYYNNYVDLRKSADKIEKQEDYERQVKDAEKLLEQARSYLEQALEMLPEDKPTIIMLKTVYLQMGLNDEFEAMDKKFNALKK